LTERIAADVDVGSGAREVRVAYTRQMLEEGSLAVVVRYTEYGSSAPEQCVALMKAFTDLDAADAEAARLNSVRSNERVTYFVKIARREA
jgi:hypothetical protein